jgi:hypothetical protein
MRNDRYYGQDAHNAKEEAGQSNLFGNHRSATKAE